VGAPLAMDGAKGRRCGERFPDDYLEVRYEDLVREPENTLRTVGEFLDHDLDHGRIQKNSIGRVAFSQHGLERRVQPGDPQFDRPLEQKLSAIGDCGARGFDRRLSGGIRLLPLRRAPEILSPRSNAQPDAPFLPVVFDAKLFLKSKTVVGRLIVKGKRLELTDPV